MRPRQVLVAALALSVCLGGVPASATAKTASGASYAKKIKKLLRDRLSTVALTSVSCPTRVRVRTGNVFWCRSRFYTGDRPNLRVRIDNRSGNFTVRPTTLPVRDHEDRLAMLLSRDNLTGYFTCPRNVRTRRGHQFTCSVEYTNGATGEFTLTQIGDGRVTQTYRRVSGDPEPAGDGPVQW